MTLYKDLMRDDSKEPIFLQGEMLILREDEGLFEDLNLIENEKSFYVYFDRLNVGSLTLWNNGKMDFYFSEEERDYPIKNKKELMNVLLGGNA